MKLHLDKPSCQMVTAHGPRWIAIDGQRIEHSVIFSSRGERLPWGCDRFEQLDSSHFTQLAGLEAELIIFGSGTHIRFPPPAWLQPLMARRIGFETMSTAAACRTYNILAGEGRHVVAALLIEPAFPAQAQRLEVE